MKQEQLLIQNANMIIKNTKEKEEKIKNEKDEEVDWGKISFLDENEFKKYKNLLIKLAKNTDKNREIMYQPFLKTGKYWKKPIKKIVNLTRSAELEGEIWKPDKVNDETTFQVSNYGRVRKIWKENGKYRGEILFQYEKCAKSYTTSISGVEMDDYYDGYLCVDLPNKKGKIIYQLVAEYWLVDKPENLSNYEIHHINNNGYENIPENLIYLTKEQHRIVHGKE